PSPRSSSRPGSTPEAEVETPYIEILDNPLGFLRIREEPSTQSDEVAQAKPGEKLPYLNEEENGWYKVTYKPGKTGWVARGASGTEYAKLVN
ncbi:MAG: SH3 domain-containing protein, partial [Candidatus Chisholmbacteria bacterium]|nr:SH3 domain-containing protein [Candidatus Chisholmbacteria bacterium]